jgi:hypothetical protein
MAIDVEVFGQLLPGRPRRYQFAVTRPVTVAEVAAWLRLVAPDEIGLIAIDGVQSELDDIVPVDCRLCFFPPMTGG